MPTCCILSVAWCPDPMHWCDCTGATALMQLHSCNCTHATALVQLHWCNCTDANTQMQLHWCNCTDATARMQLHWCNCTAYRKGVGLSSVPHSVIKRSKRGASHKASNKVVILMKVELRYSGRKSNLYKTGVCCSVATMCVVRMGAWGRLPCWRRLRPAWAHKLPPTLSRDPFFLQVDTVTVGPHKYTRGVLKAQVSSTDQPVL